jgi:hypothetical protein
MSLLLLKHHEQHVAHRIFDRLVVNALPQLGVCFSEEEPEMVFYPLAHGTILVQNATLTQKQCFQCVYINHFLVAKHLIDLLHCFLESWLQGNFVFAIETEHVVEHHHRRMVHNLFVAAEE